LNWLTQWSFFTPSEPSPVMAKAVKELATANQFSMK